MKNDKTTKKTLKTMKFGRERAQMKYCEYRNNEKIWKFYCV